MKKNIIHWLIIYAIGFAALFLLRVGYSYLSGEFIYTSGGAAAVSQRGRANMNNAAVQMQMDSSSSYAGKKNYATERQVFRKESMPAAAVTIDQKYERVATVVTRSSEFEKSEKTIRTNIAKYNAVVQYEQNAGLKGSRTLVLTIGVLPDKFDSMVGDVKKIGELISVEVNKFDKTSEFKEIASKRAALEKSRASLIALKSRGGSIKEFVDLEKQILDIENQVQSLGVTLGDFAEENEFCTVQFTLSETRTTRASLLRRLITSLGWAAKAYAAATLIIFFAALGILIITVLVEKFKWVGEKISALVKKQ